MMMYPITIIVTYILTLSSIVLFDGSDYYLKLGCLAR